MGVADDGAHSRARYGLWMLAAVLVLGLLVGWSGRVLLGPPSALPQARPFAVITVEDGSVEREIRLSASVSWVGGRPLPSDRAGMLTSAVAKEGQVVKNGDVLATVDLRPVVILEGSTPSFRELREGSTGADVRQLQAAMGKAGYSSAGANGVFGPSTTAAVRAWQKALGIRPTGVVEQGDVLFSPGLPSVWSWGKGIAAGNRIDQGRELGTVLPHQPTFVIALPPNQAALVNVGTAVMIESAHGPWKATVVSIGPTGEDGTVDAVLAAPQGSASICGQDCADIPSSGLGGLVATLTVVPETKGPTVPLGALVVGADGSTAVMDEAGREHRVTVVASAGGRAVVSGLALGTRIRVTDRGAP